MRNNFVAFVLYVYIPHLGSSSLAGVTGTPTQNTISQILKKNYIDLHRIISINPTNVAGYFYSAELISNATDSPLCDYYCWYLWGREGS